VTWPLHPITFDDLRDAVEGVALVDIEDSELAERGVPLVSHEVLMDGLGPSHYTLVELETGEQYLLHRLEFAPLEGVNIVATLTGDAAVLTDRLMKAMGLPTSRVRWRVPQDVWASMLESYDADARQRWLKRTGRKGQT